MTTDLFLKTISDKEGPLQTMALDHIDFMGRQQFRELCADMQRLVDLDAEVAELGAKMSLKVKDRHPLTLELLEIE